MIKTISLFVARVLVATIAASTFVSAQVVHYVGAGASAMYQGFEVAAVNDIGPLVVNGGTATIHHWSIKTSHTGGCGGTCAAGVDNRSTAISPQYGNLWVVWVCNTAANPCPAGGVTDIWAYLSIDATVGVRLFLAQQTATQHSAFLQLALTIDSTTPDNAVSPGLLTAGAPGNGATATCPTGFSADCDDSSLDPQVISALGGATGIPITAGMTDIRPEDAKLATNRTLTTSVDTYQTGCAAPPCRSWALGYGNSSIGGTPLVGAPIKSATITGTGSTADPVQFGLPGYKDPFNTTLTVPTSIVVIPVGEAPIVFITNRTNTTSGLGVSGASGHIFNASTDPTETYWVINVWDQHPWPPNGNPPAVTTRRPLGNLFTGHDCATDNAAFDWPADGGNRLNPPAGITNINLWLREPLSGTMNVAEFTEFRRYGTTNGNGPTGNGQPALTSQEQNVDPVNHTATDNPLTQTCITEPGTRYRGIGTTEVAGTSGNGGVLNQADSIAYVQFSFGNVSKLATSTKYGYLTIDGIDPLFDNYNNTSANPGQPAVEGEGTTYGELPACNAQTGKPVFCKANAVWQNADSICGGSTGCSYPHLRDGTYPAWSEERLMCDTVNSTHCTVADDSYGAEALVQHLQFDIHNNNSGGVPDLLPFSDAASGGLSFNPPFGDVGFVREHYAFELSTGNADTPPTSTHQSAPEVVFASFCGGGSNTPVTGPAPSNECGGDAGGWIVAAGSTATGTLQ
jgi:hypothetical protein